MANNENYVAKNLTNKCKKYTSLVEPTHHTVGILTGRKKCSFFKFHALFSNFLHLQIPSTFI